MADEITNQEWAAIKGMLECGTPDDGIKQIFGITQAELDEYRKHHGGSLVIKDK